MMKTSDKIFYSAIAYVMLRDIIHKSGDASQRATIERAKMTAIFGDDYEFLDDDDDDKY